MPYYSVHIHGENAEAAANELRNDFSGRRPDYTGHPFFYVKNHSRLADFKQKIVAGLPEGHEADIRTITKQRYEGR